MSREVLYLQDIIECVEAIGRFLKNVQKDDFLKSDLIQSAVLQKLTIIGEAATRVSEELRNSHSEIPWKEIRGFRNISVHAYFSIDWNIVWNAATINAPKLGEQIREILRTEFPDFDLRSDN